MQPAYSNLTPANAAESPIVVSPQTNQPKPTVNEQFRFDVDSVSASDGGSIWRMGQGRVLLTLNQLSVLSQNGIELADAIEIVAENCADESLAVSLANIHESISSGHAFSAAVAMHGTHFPPTLAPMLAAAEASGDVPATLARICKRMRGELAMQGTIIGAMIYPMILIAASTVVMAALVLGVLPQFGRVFESMGRPVPFYTQTLLDLGGFCRESWIALGVTATMSILLLMLIRKHSIIQKPFGHFMMYGPLIRNAYRPLLTGRVLRTLASMLQGGVPLLQAVQLTRRTVRDRYWRSLLSDVEETLIDGLPASKALEDVDFIPPETAQLVLTAEKSGQLGDVLEDVGAFYEEEAERRIKRLVVALEPAIIVVMGVLVAAIVMSVMLPLLDISTIRS